MVKYFKYTLCWKTGQVFHFIAANSKDIAHYISVHFNLQYDRANIMKHEIGDGDRDNPNVIFVQNAYSQNLSRNLIERRMARVKQENITWVKVR